MLALERQLEIINYLKIHKVATVQELSSKFFISSASIRRDLSTLEKQGLVKRTYGGAVLLEGLSEEIPIFVRQRQHTQQKARIGQLAASCINNNDIIAIDSSSTSLSIVDYLKNKQNLVIITNGLKTASTAGDLLHTRVYCVGGKLRENSSSLIGKQAENFINYFSIQKLFFSCRALSPKGPIDSSDDEAELRKVMIAQSQKVFLLCDSSKFDTQSFYHICSLDCIDCLITEKRPSDAWMALLSQHGIEVMF